MPPQFLVQQGLGLEVMYAFVILVCTFVIYRSTRELAHLSSYKAIHYFRYSFLFFGIAFFFRSVTKYILVVSDLGRTLGIHPASLSLFSLLIFLYAGTVAVFYLFYSLLWKRMEGYTFIPYILHVVALFFAVSSVLYRSLEIFLSFIALFLVCIFILIYVTYTQQRKQRRHTLLTYLLLFIFWVLNMVDMIVPQFFQPWQLILQLASLGIFMSITFRVVRKAGE